jgi:hypothetical protein
MLLPHSLDLLVTAHHRELMRQADNERLASQVARREPTRWRSRLAEALYALATRLDPCAAQDGLPRRGDRLNCAAYRTLPSNLVRPL